VWIVSTAGRNATNFHILICYSVSLLLTATAYNFIPLHESIPYTFKNFYIVIALLDASSLNYYHAF
jgi:hypothetical protein